MLNKRRNIGRNSIRNLFSLFLFSVSVFSILVYASNTTADAATVDCQIIKPEHYTHYRFVDSKYHKGLQVYHNSICKIVVEDDSWDLDKGNRFMIEIVARCVICRGNRIYHDFLEYIKKEFDIPESIVLALKKFCIDTYDPAKFAGIKFKELQRRTEWLRNEVFCQVTHEIANPSGFWEQLLEPDLPSIKKYQERTDSICRDLRNGDLTYEEAVYRWTQADLKFNQQLGPETVKKLGRDLKKPIEIFVDMLK